MLKPTWPVTLHIDNDEVCRAEASTIAQVIKPQWKSKELKFQYFSEGITNKILSCWCVETGSNVRVLFRIYGEKTELIIDRQKEVDNMNIFDKAGIGAQYYGSFNNGIAYSFIPGDLLTVETIRSPELFRLITSKMVDMHMLKGRDDQSPQKPVLFDKTLSFINLLPESFDDPKLQERFSSQYPSKETLLNRLDQLKKELIPLKSPVVFCHNDLLIGNIVHDQHADKIYFIDHEYAAQNYQAFDIANHFNEFAGVDNSDFSRYPASDLQHKWLKLYLENWNRRNELESPSDNDVEMLFVQVNKFAQASHFFWSIWAIIQAKNSTIDFDFLQYGIDRYAESEKMGEKFGSLKLPALPVQK